MTQYENIPSELRALNQWVCAYGDRKVPMCSWIRSPASSVLPETWSSFQSAVSAVQNKTYDYCGFVFADNGIIGIDIDDGYDDEGFMTPLAAEIIGRCCSYTEKSKSGTGFHILLKGDIPFRGRNNLRGLEIYKSARFFIMTGDIVMNSQIVENQTAIDYILEKYFPENRDAKSGKVCNRIYSPVWEEPKNRKLRVRPKYPKIPNGSRNVCLTSLAGMMHTIGYSKKHITDELMYANKVACDPPLDEYEVVSIVNSVTKYKR